MKRGLWVWCGLWCGTLGAEPARVDAGAVNDHNSFVALCVAFCIVVGYSWWRSRHV